MHGVPVWSDESERRHDVTSGRVLQHTLDGAVVELSLNGGVDEEPDESIERDPRQCCLDIW